MKGAWIACLVALLVTSSCSEVPHANVPGQTPPPTAPPPSLTVPPTTPAPASPAATTAATATPRRAFKIGEAVGYQDGWRLTVLKIEETAAGQFFTPKPGMRYVSVIVRFDNGGSKPVSANPFFFKLQDTTGVRRDITFLSTRDDRLSATRVAPGAFVVGSVTFEAPVGDKTLQLIYEQFGYSQTTVELY